MNFLTGDDAPEPVPVLGMWTDEDVKRFYALVNSHMQGTYSAALGNSTRAHNISDKIGTGFKYATECALQEMGVLPKEV